MNDAPRRTSNVILAHAVLSAGLNLASSVRSRGPRRAAVFFALGTGMPALGELLVTGPLKLLRHRTRPRIRGVPLAIVLDWYCVIHGVCVLTERLLARLPEEERSKAMPLAAAFVGTSLDLILDPFGLDAGLWEWNAGGAYASEIKGVNGRRGVPLINYLGWASLLSGVTFIYERVYESTSGRSSETGRLPALLLLPYYLAAVVWAVRQRKFRYLLYSAPFPVALYASLKKR